ncbi:MAG TPA: Ig-like domain-containing protein [Symbiobacteriaceae bacterium]|nr:Ig-like domain-containing protein [Symbiobacteriaceae bacterium]
MNWKQVLVSASAGSLLLVVTAFCGAVPAIAGPRVPPPTVSPVVEGQEYVTGRTQPDTSIAIFLGENEIGYAFCPSGSFRVKIPPQPGGTRLKIVATDLEDNSSAPILIRVRDVTPPEPPKVNRVGSSHTEVTGTAEPGATVTILLANNPISSATVGEDGKFSVQITPLSVGARLRVSVKDEAGNTSWATLYVEDTTPPAVPLLDPVTAEQTQLTGTTERSVAVTVRSGDRVLGAAKSDALGRFTIEIGKQAPGTILTVTAEDSKGNVGRPSEVRVTPAGTVLIQTAVGQRLISVAESGVATVAEEVDGAAAASLDVTALTFDLSQPAVKAGPRRGIVTEVSVTLPAAVLQRAAAAETRVVILAPFARIDIPARAVSVPANAGTGAAIGFRLTGGAATATDRAELSALGFTARGGPLRFQVDLVSGGSAAPILSLTEKAVLRLNTRPASVPELLGVHSRYAETAQWEPMPNPALLGTGEMEVSVDAAGAYVVGEFTRRFADVPRDHPAAGEILWMAARGLVKGKSTNRFEPEAPVTRAELSALMVRSFGLSASTGSGSAFADVTAADWFARDVEAAAAAGLMRGAGNLFRPGDLVSRQELAVVISRALRMKGLTAGATELQRQQWAEFYRDSATVSVWASDAVADLSERGILTGHGYSFDPQVAATRAEVAAAVRRALALRE